MVEGRLIQRVALIIQSESLMQFAIHMYSGLPTLRRAVLPHHGADDDLRPNLRFRRSKMGRGSSFFRDERGATSSKMGGFFQDGRFFDLTAAKNETPLPIFDHRSRKNEETPPSSTFSAGRTKNPLFSSSSDPPFRPILIRSSQLP